MYQGRIVETGPTDTVWQAPQHPYTQKLLASLPPELSGLQAASAV
jgi:peptide/nickel transport system ATP-binding protein